MTGALGGGDGGLQRRGNLDEVSKLCAGSSGVEMPKASRQVQGSCSRMLLHCSSLGYALRDDGSVQRDAGTPCAEVACGFVTAGDLNLTVK